MTEPRTPKQIAADKLDLEMFRLYRALSAFDTDYRERSVGSAADIVNGLRTRVRAHMHPRDREETNQ